MGKDVIIALDFDSREKTLAFLDRFTEEKPFVKVGMELFYAEGPAIVREIRRRGHRIFLDLKLHDIPNTVRKAMAALSALDVDMEIRQPTRISLQEVEALLSSGVPRDATALQAIGYRQFLAVRDGAATAADAIGEVKLRSRQYAKRQLTWLRRNGAIHWILWGKEPDFPAALQNATEYLTAHGLG